MKTIKDWASDDRPREKMIAKGAESLSNAELMAILIGSGIPGISAVDLMRQILGDYNDSLKLLGRATLKDLMNSVLHHLMKIRLNRTSTVLMNIQKQLMKETEYNRTSTVPMTILQRLMKTMLSSRTSNVQMNSVQLQQTVMI